MKKTYITRGAEHLTGDKLSTILVTNNHARSRHTQNQIDYESNEFVYGLETVKEQESRGVNGFFDIDTQDYSRNPEAKKINEFRSSPRRRKMKSLQNIYYKKACVQNSKTHEKLFSEVIRNSRDTIQTIDNREKISEEKARLTRISTKIPNNSRLRAKMDAIEKSST